MKKKEDNKFSNYKRLQIFKDRLCYRISWAISKGEKKDKKNREY